ncbi:hypothetical protein XA68_16632 [Ophiocordyceps unilateralis]|uniref:Nickel/cobalt efflux system n=1 Tax=Ophiocordyceps unilateralis TaxID=268505 RepID=A0A2A9PSJ0_OPHUN|nr:hypothetical protein XA68_16632 [Ophiocordyceps unilateralis]
MKSSKLLLFCTGALLVLLHASTASLQRYTKKRHEHNQHEQQQHRCLPKVASRLQVAPDETPSRPPRAVPYLSKPGATMTRYQCALSRPMAKAEAKLDSSTYPLATMERLSRATDRLGLSALPGRSVVVIASVALVNGIVWAAAGIVLRFHPVLAPTALLCYTLGLRHGLDADHISAIDLVTRRLIAEGRRPATVVRRYFYCCVWAAADDNDNDDDEEEAQAATMPRGFGLVARFTSFLYKSIDRPWKMFPLGLVFGLGFDTSSEVALLGIASVHAAEGTSIWLILVFPVLFTAGMCLVDSADGALMMGLYTSKAFARDDLAILYYSIVLTSLTIAVSFFIGVIQVLSLAQNVAHPQGPFWDGVTAVTDRFDAIGGGICALFVVVGLASVIAYRPWRKHIDRRQRGLSATAEESLPETDGRPSPSQEVLSQGLGERGG